MACASTQWTAIERSAVLKQLQLELHSPRRATAAFLDMEEGAIYSTHDGRVLRYNRHNGHHEQRVAPGRTTWWPIDSLAVLERLVLELGDERQAAAGFRDLEDGAIYGTTDGRLIRFDAVRECYEQRHAVPLECEQEERAA